ncbi:waprin-like protein isoform X2 [Zophobas morio]|uniref:waprin-like protein isoform X2 n=1 Tax=Zophobas morio TaxID=2755281 RepID=UPI0030835C57
MDLKIVVLMVVIGTTVALSTSNCPTPTRIASCSPKCKDNSNCQGAKVCCTNICGTKSCTDIYQYQNGDKNDKYGSSKGATGTYCGNVKCSAGEKCELDRTTKRQKCVRG